MVVLVVIIFLCSCSFVVALLFHFLHILLASQDGHDAEAVQLYERCLSSAQLSKDAALEGSACHKLLGNEQ